MELLLVFVAVFLGQTIGQLGMLACCVGVVVTLPLAQLIGFAAHAEWARATDDTAP
jgi:hypothetical protein